VPDAAHQHKTGEHTEAQPRPRAVVWFAVLGDDDATRERDRGNQLGAANVVCERLGLPVAGFVESIAAGVEDPEARERALCAARVAGALILPDSGRVAPSWGQLSTLVSAAEDDGYRLVMVDLGWDTCGGSGQVLTDWLATARQMSAPDLDVPVPPPALRRRVSVGSEETFRYSAVMHIAGFSRALRRAGGRLDRAETVLDWGAGCGRLIPELLRLAPRATITAVDPDVETIAWTADNFPVNALATSVDPPLPFADDSFDLIIGHSVLSHLDAAAQDRWLAELARVARPGAAVALSINGPTALSWHVQHPLAAVPQSLADETAVAGIAFWREDGWEAEFHDDYHTTFHDLDYVRRHWSQWFEVVAIEERAAAPAQDIVALRAPGGRRPRQWRRWR
jgi:SAM-dependent methyltransferase